MKVLLLEDDYNRQNWFIQKFWKHQIDITDNPKLANEWATKNNYDVIFLDHDLADEHYIKEVICNETTGLCTAEFLGNNEQASPNAQIVVHSLNYNGRARMMTALKNRDKREVPYNLLRQNLTVS